jgi:hypothetical protein
MKIWLPIRQYDWAGSAIDATNIVGTIYRQVEPSYKTVQGKSKAWRCDSALLEVCVNIVSQ